MAESVANAVFLRSRAGREEELAGRLEALVLASRSDSGVMTYDLHRSAADPASWFLGLAHAQEMKNRPQTLYRIEDSPVGLAAWMLDHDARSYALIARVFAGQPEGLTRDDILDNVTLYWLTNTAVSSARLYWESNLPFSPRKGSPYPSP